MIKLYPFSTFCFHDTATLDAFIKANENIALDYANNLKEFEDIANAVWYFADDVSKNTTGAELVVDGGMLAQLTPNIERELWK